VRVLFTVGGAGQNDAMRTVNSREVYTNAWMTVREDIISHPDGSPGIYGVVDKPDCALIIPLDGDRLHLVEQFRYPLGLRRWEFPQGTAPDRADTEPRELAARELREETGLRAATLTDLGLLDVAPGLASQRGRVFLATGLTAGMHDREQEEQDMRSEWFSRAEFERMIRAGTITDAQSIAAYTLFLLYERG
jgi:8-oxo-dGTP pyrophosphatase MutT (NUDIX family)